ncbi:S9 family peptidase [Flavobacterium agricola]|uniref:S9 family peptidase n=1 Tax=Flavobacterium agricola TaxID=2870839 RepID=A0ABY6M047_9FLAO|nr:S9 family peptidase [Flavobacterium agricola]UYW01197.1 S9 family peptidase [Flavobacterium agricola]
MKKILILTLSLMGLNLTAQEVMTPELLWQLGRVSPIGITKDGKNLIYRVGTPNVAENKINSQTYIIPVKGGTPKEISDYAALIADPYKAPNGDVLTHKSVLINKVLGKDAYPELSQSNAYIFDALDYKHWDSYNTGEFNHVFIEKPNGESLDIMTGEPYDSPQKPFGGSEDYVWSPDFKSVVYVSKKKFGTEYATSTNTDLYEYNLETKQTKNLTPNNPGYDTNPVFSPQGNLTWLQMKRDGYEADKNDIIVRYNGMDMNLTANWDGTVNSFKWSADGNKVYFTAPIKGSIQLFEVNFPGLKRIAPTVQQLTNGNFDVTGIVGVEGNEVLVTRNDFNHATEIFSYNLKSKKWNQITKVNNKEYSKITPVTTETKWFKTTDGKEMLVHVIFPPNFDKNKKYPTLLYCQGGPQSALTNFYSFRWNLQLMASEGYIVVAPNRRGMPGHGVEWNEAISKDWGGQVMDDYLTAIDEMAKEPYVDKDRLGAIGASYGGYSVYYLAGIHNNRFKTFISHCGVFNLESMYGTTEEVFFTNWDAGGAYWDKNNAAAQKTYAQFNPKNLVGNWNTPILIFHGGIDFRVPIGQGQEAFQAAQLQGIKSRFVFLPDENHWVVKPQNAIIWQTEFFKWLKETL